MMNTLFKQLAALCVACLTLNAVAQAEELKVMTSGGFTAAYKLLGPQYAASSGDTLESGNA